MRDKSLMVVLGLLCGTLLLLVLPWMAGDPRWGKRPAGCGGRAANGIEHFKRLQRIFGKYAALIVSWSIQIPMRLQ
jgi:hypothetical protein